MDEFGRVHWPRIDGRVSTVHIPKDTSVTLCGKEIPPFGATFAESRYIPLCFNCLIKRRSLEYLARGGKITKLVAGPQALAEEIES